MSGGGLAAADAKDDDRGPLYAQIKRVGRWRHEITIRQAVHDIPICIEAAFIWGRKRAERKARNMLQRHTGETIRIDSEVS